jgi:hypothetical protein
LASAAAVACSSPDGPLGAAGTLASSGGTAPEVGNDAGGDGGDEGLEDRGGVGSNEDQGLVDGGDGTAGGDGGSGRQRERQERSSHHGARHEQEARHYGT